MDKKITNRNLEDLVFFLRLNDKKDLAVWFIYDESLYLPDHFFDSLYVQKLALRKNDLGFLTIPLTDSEVETGYSSDKKFEFCILFFDFSKLNPSQRNHLLHMVAAKAANILVYQVDFDRLDIGFLNEKIKSVCDCEFVERYSELITGLPFIWYQKKNPEDRIWSESHKEIQTLISIVSRQRDLLNEYQQEVIRVEAESEELFHEVQRLENGMSVIRRIFHEQITEWQSFEYTSTAKLVKRVVRLKLLILPPGGQLSRYLFYTARFFQVIREEGLKSALLLTGQKFKRLLYRLQYRLSPRLTEGNVCKVEEVHRGHPRPEPHTNDVDIVICVHNALEDVQNCLASVLENSTAPYRIILVDDGSEMKTEEYLKEFSTKNQDVLLLRSDKATGYPLAANRGIRASTSEYVVLLNSDTIVGPCWLDQMIACAESDEKIGMIGPLSNTASWQSVPRVEENGDWAANPLPQGVSVREMAEFISNYSERLCVEMPFLNGFCLLIKKRLLDEVGLFDEVTFGKGYGEEDDLILRARQAGWKMALADDTFVYHAQSRSYSSDRRKALTKTAGQSLIKKHGPEIIRAGVNYCASNLVLEGIRARAAVTPERESYIQLGRKYSGKRVLFLLPSNGPGGGANVVIYEGLAMQKMGVNVEIFNLPAYRTKFEDAYPDLSIPVIYREVSDLPRICDNFDAVVATHNETVYWLAKLNQALGKFVAGYYIQGFEPFMYNPTNPRFQRALDSYSLIPNLIAFTKTRWTQDTIKQHTSIIPELIGVSLDIDLFRARPNTQKEIENRSLKVAAMVRPESPYREPEKTMQLLKKASQHYGRQIEPIIFGTTTEDPAFFALPYDFPWQLYGVISSKKVANLLNMVDIFIDYSSHQAMGLTTLEAMATGCAVLVPSKGGAVEFCKHEHNSLVVDTSNFNNVWLSLRRLIDDDKLRKTMQRNAIYDVCQYFPEKAAYNILNCLFGK